ncbi:hypothetical protein [Prescottella equi]|uniref:hypothetical protein n=1 Tax=Rhodococcus hoagii TaxID=43767 RepID=UPI000A0F9FAD|nr:hypothetical protein [Prescottella equi]ORL76416.1 hypothetical protein A5N71_16385 [Prescottella equi]
MAPTMSHQDSRARAEKAFRLNACGRTWQEVADTLGYKTRAGARQAVQRLLTSTPAESVEDGRRTAAESLRVVQSMLFGRLANAAQRQDDKTLVAVAREIRSTVSESAKMRGLYAPVKHDVDVRVEQSATAILDRAEQELLALASKTTPASIGTAVLDAEVVE